ncbi:MAG: hypothetical protein JW772_04370 [Candidatus Diapherotrites archaeon]|nr:hypothetical protein [Candidatus Diapherotrites archaeon]
MKSKAAKKQKIEKPEDKDWLDWYNKLDNKEHEKKLAQLGLEKEEIEEWEQHSVLGDLEVAAETPPAMAESHPKKSKKK